MLPDTADLQGDQLSDHCVTTMFRLAGEALRSSNSGNKHLSTS